MQMICRTTTGPKWDPSAKMESQDTNQCAPCLTTGTGSKSPISCGVSKAIGKLSARSQKMPGGSTKLLEMMQRPSERVWHRDAHFVAYPLSGWQGLDALQARRWTWNTSWRYWGTM